MISVEYFPPNKDKIKEFCDKNDCLGEIFEVDKFYLLQNLGTGALFVKDPVAFSNPNGSKVSVMDL